MKLVLGGADLDRRVFVTEGRANWSSVLPLVLEKHGRLEFEVVGPEALEDPACVDDDACMVITRLPEASWTHELVERLIARTAPTYVEGPLPRALAEGLHIRTANAPRFGSLAVQSAAVAARARMLGSPAGGKIAETVLRPVDRDPRLDWQAIPNVPLTEPQATAWRSPGWDVEAWSFDGGKPEVLAKWTSADGARKSPAIARFGSLVVSSLGLIAFLGQMHTSEPSERGHRRSSHRVIGLETLLCAILDDMHAGAGLVLARVLPWPDGARWTLNVRHDFDRPLSEGDVREVLRGHARLGTAATWYWRSRHVTPGGVFDRLLRRPSGGVAALQAVAAAACQEVAYHTERPWTGAERERRIVERALGGPVLGMSAHGAPDCFRFQGAPNVLWAEREGLVYTELIQHAHAHPHRFAALQADGTIRPLSVVCLPHHESFDRSMTQGDTNAESVAAAAERYRDQRGFMQVMNHPDLHVDALFATLAGLPADLRLDWTAAAAADWWRRTHVHDALRLTRRGERFSVRAMHDVKGATILLEHPDGSHRTAVVSLAPGETRTI